MMQSSLLFIETMGGSPRSGEGGRDKAPIMEGGPSIDLIDLDAGVVLLEDVLVLGAGDGHAVGPDLA
jgi:hypothetical protein